MARALAWHARGRRFDPDTLHKSNPAQAGFFIMEVGALHVPKAFGKEVVPIAIGILSTNRILRRQDFLL